MKQAFVSLILLALTMTARAQQVDELVQKAIQARGGREKLHSVQTLEISGSAYMMGMDMPLRILSKRPNMRRVDIEVQGQKVSQAYDGTAAWMVNPFQGTGVVEMPSAQARAFKAQADLDGLLMDYATKGYQITYGGLDTVKTHPAHRLEVLSPEGDAFSLFLDANSFLELKTAAKGTNPMTGEPTLVETFYSDYRDHDGLKNAHLIEIHMGDQLFQSISLEQYSVNLPVEDSLFARPAGQ